MNGIDFENLLSFCFDYCKIQYEQGKFGIPHWDFIVKRNDKKIAIEAKAAKYSNLIVSNYINKTANFTKDINEFILVFETLPSYVDKIHLEKNFCVQIFDLIQLIRHLEINIQENEINELKNDIVIHNYSFYRQFIERLSEEDFKSIETFKNGLKSSIQKNNEETYSKEIYGRQFSDETLVTLNKDTNANNILTQKDSDTAIIIVESDIKNFSTMVSVYGKEELSSRIEKYYDDVRTLANRYDAFFDKFVGDAVVVAFNFPYYDKQNYIKAIDFSYDLIDIGKRVFGDLNELHDEQVETGTRVGIAESELKLIHVYINEITFLGKAINLAPRLEKKCETDQVYITKEVYDNVYNHSKNDFEKKYDATYKELSTEEAKGQVAVIAAYQIERI